MLSKEIAHLGNDAHLVCSYDGNNCVHAKNDNEKSPLWKGGGKVLKADNFLVNGDGKLVGHAGNKFDDALVEAVWLGQVEHWLDGVEFD